MGEFKIQKMSPVFLSATANLGEGATSGPLSSIRLANPFRTGTIITNINFTLYSPVAELVYTMGQLIRCRLSLGRIAITSSRFPQPTDFVPVSSFAPRVSPTVESQAGTVGIDTALQRRQYENYRWILPKPVYLPPGNIINAEFSRAVDGIGGTAVAWIGYAGFALTPESDRLPETNVPYIASFTAPNTTNQLGQSGDFDLTNPFLNNLNIQRFILRSRSNLAGQFVDSDLSVISNAYTIRMKDSIGYEVIKEPIMMRAAIDMLRRSWTFNKVLGPRQWYATTLAGPSDGVRTVTISMIGYRKESV